MIEVSEKNITKTVKYNETLIDFNLFLFELFLLHFLLQIDFVGFDQFFFSFKYCLSGYSVCFQIKE